MTLNNLLFCLAIAAFVGLPTLGLLYILGWVG